MIKTDEFCTLPWVELQITPTGAVKTCCEQAKSYSDAPTDGLKFVFNNNAAKEVRKKFLSGNVPTNCASCVQRSKFTSTYRTHRSAHWQQHTNQIISETSPEGFTASPIRFLDLRLSNLCNFACRTCESASSSRWTKLDTLLGRPSFELTKWNENENVVKDIFSILPEVEEIYFAGGEPLIIDGHFAILDWLIKNGRKDVRLSYNTNLSTTVYKGKDIRSYWGFFDNVDVQVSIDAIGTKGEYIREGFNWEKFQKNFAALKDYIRGSNTVVSVYNVYCVLDLIDWINSEYSLISTLYGLFHPASMSVTVLPEQIKNDIKKTYESFLSQKSLDPVQVQQLRSIIDYMERADHSGMTRQFKVDNQILDLYHARSFTAIFPELADWYYHIQL